ncbi:hypothetical protein [uncultured Subdoligranulum sp.]|uniref:Uncharacterized protein n=1 Tax=Candidatus Gemmiger excrementavium TaxID=2838608 RepID=A0A9D2JFZ0_9FIRM|nr:hypothetical protein [uncultured Subdoligranulum sp.]HIZ48143.1 hypothetical protein [Candidatus Gemmiger excrementavium]
MEALVEIIGEIVLTVLQEVWPPILAIVNGLLVLVLAFLTWLFFTQGEPARAVISLLAVVLFLTVGILGFRTGLYTGKGRTNSRRKR